MLDRPMEHFTASDALTLRYAEDDFTPPWESADTLILIHAAMGSSRRMHLWVPHLCGQVRVVRPDMRGHGQSEIPGDGQLSLPRLTQDVVELMDHLGVEKAHVAGSSAGGIVAMNTAITYPDRVISVAPFASLPGLKMSAGYTRYDTWVDRIGSDGIAAFLRETIDSRFDLSKVSPGFVDWFIAEADRNDVNLLGRFVGVMADADISDRLGEIRCPALAVVPSGDPLHNMEQYEILKERIPDCEFVVYEGMPHNITDAVPVRCATELSRFIRRVTAPASGAEG